MKKSYRSSVDSFLVMDVMEAALKLERMGKSIIHMEVGQPCNGADSEALSKFSSVLNSSNLGYSSTLGLPELRTGISKLYKKQYNLDINPNRVIVTSGSSSGFILTFLAFFNPGNRIIIGTPGYPSYKNILKSLNLIPIEKETKFEEKFQLNVENLRDTKAEGLLIASPANPTGTVLDRNELSKLIKFSRQKSMTFISDEIYHGITYEKESISALEIDNNVIVINSFSKFFSMTGWRVGWMVVPEEYVETIEKLSQNLFICPPHSSQMLALYSLDSIEKLNKRVEVFKENRSLLLKQLPELGFTELAPPDGGFYIYANIRKFNTDSKTLASEILNEVGVALTPGYDFDKLRGKNTIRFSYACSTENVIEALKRLKIWRHKRRP